jgi:protein TonB
VTVDSSTTLPSDGVREGTGVGVEGGVVGGVPRGVPGGVLGGTGTGPVMDYDSAPRPIRITRPEYPAEAFARKIEGTVVVEILIDSQGRVVRARVIQSVPLLDAAALQTVYQWTFQPAVKHGRPVPTIAHAPVAFRIYGKEAPRAQEQRKQRPANGPD